MPKLSPEQKKNCQWSREYRTKQRKVWRHVERVKTDWPAYRRFPLFGAFAYPTKEAGGYDTRIFITEGGWCGRRWMSTRELEKALERWVKRSYGTALAVTEGGSYQCGGCRFFGALDGDYGLCCNADSVQDGRVCYEHGGCPQH